MNKKDMKAKVKEFFMKHKWKILAVTLLTTGVGVVSYRAAFKRGGLLDRPHRERQQNHVQVDQRLQLGILR